MPAGVDGEMSEEIRKIALEFFKDKFGVIYNKQIEHSDYMVKVRRIQQENVKQIAELKEVLRELIAVYEQENLVETGLLEKLTSGGEKEEVKIVRETIVEDIPTSDSKLPEPMKYQILPCDNCWKKGNYDLFMCPTKEKCLPARDYSPKGPEPKEKIEPKCEYLWQQTEDVKRCTHDRNTQPNMKLDGETPGFCTEAKCPLKTEPKCPICNDTGINTHIERDELGLKKEVDYPCQCQTEPEKTDMLDSLLHATTPIPLSEVRKLIDDSNNRLIEEFIEDLESFINVNLKGRNLDYKIGLIRNWRGRVN